MKVVYVAGPFRAESAWDIEQNIRRAEEIALECWRAGFAVFCPHTNTRFFQGAAPDDIWLRGDMELLGRCDIVVTVPGWEDSTGATAEVTWASNHGMPVLHHPEQLKGQ